MNIKEAAVYDYFNSKRLDGDALLVKKIIVAGKRKLNGYKESILADVARIKLNLRDRTYLASLKWDLALQSR